MSYQFTEYARPVKIAYSVVVTPLSITHVCACENDRCARNDLYQCECCKCWFCLTHDTSETDVCENCMRLPIAIRQRIIDFIEEIEALL